MARKFPITTIITDAAYNNQLRKGSWAGRIICEGRRSQYSGLLKGETKSSNDAELMAIVNTIFCGAKDGSIRAGYGWLIQTDSQTAINLLAFHKICAPTGNKATPTTKSKKAIKVLLNLIREVQPEFIELRHVKAHKKLGEREKRHHVHEAVDRLAAKAMRDGVKEELLGGWLMITCTRCKAEPFAHCVSSGYPMRLPAHWSRMQDAYILKQAGKLQRVATEEAS